MGKRIGFIGLGAMGKPMAKNILKKGIYDLTVFDLNKTAVEDLKDMGATAAESVADLTRSSDVIITMVPNSPNVEAIVYNADGILQHIKANTLLIDMSTIDPAVSRRVAKDIAKKEARMIDAPVGRTTDHAKEGTLSIMVGGDEDLFEECKPILSCMGTDIIYCGPIGSGETMKIVNNLLTGILVTANAEALTLGKKAGLKLETMLEVLRSTSANNGHLNVTFPAKAFKGDFTPGFATRLAYKDMNLALNLAGQVNLPLMLGSTSTQLFNMARSTGHDNDDYTSVITVLEELAGVTVRSKSE
jgi:4-hydroxybutyrate dehydrogenase/sulfolactaldehyde 3-reductase